MSTPLITREEMARRKRKVFGWLKGSGIPRADIEQIVEKKIIALKKIKKRAEIVNRTGVPVIKSLFTADQAWFNQYIKRHQTGMTLEGERVFAYLRSPPHRISEGVAKQFALVRGGNAFSLRKMRQRVEYLWNYPLDPKKYGISRLPKKVIEKLLKREPSELARGIKRTLRVLEDVHSARRLDAVLPDWRKRKSVLGSKAKRVSPTRVLSNYLTGKESNVPITTRLLSSGSRQRIKEGLMFSLYVAERKMVNGTQVVVPRSYGVSIAQKKLAAYRARIREFEQKYVLQSSGELKGLVEYLAPLNREMRALQQYIDEVLPVEKEKMVVGILKNKNRVPHSELSIQGLIEKLRAEQR